MRGIIGTAGHIDHGKTALIGALTGDETDRLPEEKARGISIDLGFSRLEVADARLGIVDVPGHEDFIRNMLAGATGIDVLLLVVAADEGIMPQTREHTAIAELLGVRRAVVALTKVDLVSDEWLGLVHDELAEFLADTPFAGAEVVATSAVTGQGMDELQDTLGRVFQGSRGRPDDLFRLPVDRVFTVRGTGTVVTGTVWSGRLHENETVRLLPDGPEARVRGLQVHGLDVPAIEAGERAAVALVGVDREDVLRGMTLVDHPAWDVSTILTVRLRVLPGSHWSVEDRQRVRVHLGTAEVMARTVLLDQAVLPPGAEAWAQLRLEAPLVARAGDRFVVRSYSPVTTIGGGTVAEPAAPRRSRLDGTIRRLLTTLAGASAGDAARALIASAGETGVELRVLPLRTTLSPLDAQDVRRDTESADGRVFAQAAFETTRARLVEAVDRFHRQAHLQPGIEPEALRRAGQEAHPALVERSLETLLEDGTLTLRQGRMARAGWSVELSEEEAALAEALAARLAEHDLAPPRTDELLAELAGSGAAGAKLLTPDTLAALLDLLEERGRVARVEHDLFMDRAALDGAVAGIRDRFAGRSGLGPADFREVVDVSRRHLMPLLAYLDQTGVTVRSEEGRAVHA